VSITFSDVEEVLRIVDQFPVAEIRFTHGDLHLYVKRVMADTVAGQVAEPATTTPAASTPAPGQTAASTVAALPTAPTHPIKAKPPSAVGERRGWTAIESPLIGVFYAAPAPGAEPFVKEHQKVVQGADLCIIEVMKVMNTIKAPCAGVVMDIDAVNGAMVEQGQVLMWIQPTGEIA
jgi:acetyl-CoA carboxylase biotin carboxyl carrier protein